MPISALVKQIVTDDRLTNRLDDAEARMLIEWLIDSVENLPTQLKSRSRVVYETQRLCRRARSIARFVTLWCHENAFGPALQLAASERFAWPLPCAEMDACDLMGDILAWESARRRV